MNLKPLRKQIDQIDQKILLLLNKRLDLARKVAEAKASNGGALFVPEREAEQLARLSPKKAQGKETSVSFEAVFREILSCSRALQAVLVGRGQFRVGYIGKVGCTAHLAARENFGAQTLYVAYATEKRALAALSQNKVEFIISPKRAPRGYDKLCTLQYGSKAAKPFYVLAALPKS